MSEPSYTVPCPQPLHTAKSSPVSDSATHISLTMTSATKGVTVKMAVRKEASVKKAMKKFGMIHLLIYGEAGYLNWSGTRQRGRLLGF